MPRVSVSVSSGESDNEAPAPRATQRSRKSTDSHMGEDEPTVNVKSNVAKEAEDEDEDEDKDGDDDGEEEEEYVVEAILDHQIGNDGEPLFQVKWEGYGAADCTWEPEENLESAKEILEEYLSKIGGRDAIFEQSKSVLKNKKRGRQSTGSVSSTSAKRRKNGSHPLDSEPPKTVEAKHKLPSGSWEEHIRSLDVCEDEDTGKLMVYLTWINGKKTQHGTDVVYKKCPQKMLKFYESHVKIMRREPEPAGQAEAKADDQLS